MWEEGKHFEPYYSFFQQKIKRQHRDGRKLQNIYMIDTKLLLMDGNKPIFDYVKKKCYRNNGI